MAYNLPPLNWLRSFEASARKVSFTAAAEELNLTAAAVSYQVRSLEEHLGFPLFERLPRSLRLTEMGRAYLPAVRKAFGELSASTVGLFGMKGEVTISIRAPISFMTRWLSSNIGKFNKLYPDVGVRLYCANWVDKLMADKVDIDIRYGDGNWDGENAEKLFDEEVILVCSPQYLEKKGPIQSLGDLVSDKHNLIHVMGVEDSWEQLFRSFDVEYEEKRNETKVDSSMVALALARADQGIAFLYRSFVQDELADQRLVCPFEFEWFSDFAHYLVIPDEKTKPRPEIILFRDWIREELQQTKRYISKSES